VKKLPITAIALCGLLLLPGTGQASFVLITNTSGLTTEKFFNGDAHPPGQGVHSFVGSVPQAGDAPVTVTAGAGQTVTVSSGAGFATIKPDVGLLTSLTFTPQDSSLFNDWVTNGQFDGPSGATGVVFSISVTDQNGNVTTFNNLPAQSFSNGGYPFDIGVVSNDGSTIKSVTLSADNLINGVHYGIKESKQTEFSLAHTPTPEPSTMALALSGLVTFGFAGLRRFRRQPQQGL
jgi:hypothetical protein